MALSVGGVPNGNDGTMSSLPPPTLFVFICPGYSRACFQIRNEWMVDHSALVIAVFNGQPSGTKNTIDYAKRKSVPCWNILSET